MLPEHLTFTHLINSVFHKTDLQLKCSPERLEDPEEKKRIHTAPTDYKKKGSNVHNLSLEIKGSVNV